MQEFNKLAHAVWECKYHVVWCPKYRFKILSGELRHSVRDIIRQLCEWKKIRIVEGNVQIDHIHLVLSVPPKYSISEAIGFLKGKSAIKLFDMYLDLKKRYWGRHFWETVLMIFSCIVLFCLRTKLSAKACCQSLFPYFQNNLIFHNKLGLESMV